MQKRNVLILIGLTLGTLLTAGSTASAKNIPTKPIPAAIQGTWKGAYRASDAGYPFKMIISKYTLSQNGNRFYLQSNPNSKNPHDFIMSAKPNKKGYWKFTLTASHDNMYLKRIRKNGKPVLIRYSYDTHKKPVIQYLYH